MCDTMVARPPVTKNGTLIFAKNSDREANEAQYLFHAPAQTHAPGSELACTYISIPQVERTNAVLLSRPYWMWGAEMGVNEHGVLIGNEAVFSKLKPQKEPALIGMDLLRLGLERAASAQEAVEVITSLLAQYGQGGNCGHNGHFEYHNAFLIADAGGTAFVLETVGREYVLERAGDVRTISNAYTVGTEYERVSDGLIPQARAKGWAGEKAPFDFAEAYGDRLRSRFATGYERGCRTRDLLGPKAPHIEARHVMGVLRDHGPRAARQRHWQPDGLLGGSVCAHASFGPVRKFGQTTSSWITEIRNGRMLHWVTGTSAPDTGIFKPVFFGPGCEGIGLPDFGPVPGGRYEEAALWWRHEKLHRAVLENYGPRLAAYAGERDRLEESFMTEVAGALERGADEGALEVLTGRHWRRAEEAEKAWLKAALAVPVNARQMPPPSHFYRFHWKRLNRLAHMPEIS